MRAILFDARGYERDVFTAANNGRHDLLFCDARLTPQTAAAADGCGAAVCFVNDQINERALARLKAGGVRLIALRSAGYNHVDLKAANELGLPVVRVPEYSPYAVAEHALALLMTLNRKTHRAYNRVREMNFSLEGLIGFDVHGKTVGIIGAGRIGSVFAGIMLGMGCKVLIYDPNPPKDLGAVVPLDRLLGESDVISLHVPLLPETRHLIDARALSLMKSTSVLINTGRGALIDTRALIVALKGGKIGGACLDVYEEEEGIFFNDLSARGLQDDVLARLLTFPNVLITSHQGFLTREALHAIASTTLANLTAFDGGRPLKHQL